MPSSVPRRDHRHPDADSVRTTATPGQHSDLPARQQGARAERGDGHGGLDDRAIDRAVAERTDEQFDQVAAQAPAARAAADLGDPSW
ncbi:hypothetical protein A4R43_03440 [Amycolatopsis albispora]|uniref:Uncharacterized protein n=1 Tax=Amycolatopsis albispora TaxID=1804986 RepID=A0A344L0W2_9PSEU|nr:hypothetical protein A4R43_03440 [Amycolatopsis albispora]